MIKKHAFILIVGLLFSVVFAQTKSVSAPFSRGINFSEWLEFKTVEQINPTYMTKQDFVNVKSMGCDVIRLPVHFETLSSGAPNYIIAPELFIILDDVVSWANELELYVIFDFHNDTTGGSATPKNIEQIVLSIWKQVSSRYANSGKYIAYEIYNEPHKIDKVKWGKIEEKVVKEIRKNDSEHYIVVGGADFNSFEAMKSLPKFKDDKIIYTFHFYEPMLFTHQGAYWTGQERLVNIPFPYDKERMPKAPGNLNGTESWYLGTDYNYKTKGTEAYVAKYFDQYVKFSQERNAPIYCGEFGVLRDYADPVERANWYRIVTKLLDDRDIPHTSWDYLNGFGPFKKDSSGRFPEDLDRAVVEAMNLKVPEKSSIPTWFSSARKTGDYTIFDNGFACGIRPIGWDVKVKLLDTTQPVKVIDFISISSHNRYFMDFGESVDLSNLVAKNYNLVMEVKNDGSDFKFGIWFQDAAKKTKYEWRMCAEISSKEVPNDGKYHKIVIPLKNLIDVGAWDSKNNTWINGQKRFDWSDVNQFVIANTENPFNGSVKFKTIKIEK